jgi:hypothetical protein
MATQVIGAVRRSRRGVALIVVALAFAVAVLVAQASSIWSSETGSHGPPVMQVAVDPQDTGKVGHLFRPGCRPKYGCSGETTSGRP